jgi:hypothetical protein
MIDKGSPLPTLTTKTSKEFLVPSIRCFSKPLLAAPIRSAPSRFGRENNVTIYHRRHCRGTDFQNKVRQGSEHDAGYGFGEDV